jgi:pyridoxine 5-phosphate synthase
LERIVTAAEIARELELTVNAGHGITYDNVRELLRAFSFDELNIGFVIVARSVAVGMETAVREMKTCVAS